MNIIKQNIAVVGAGVAGITAAYLLQQKHNVTIFDKNDYLGGHTNTIVISDGVDAGTAVDTGFIVLNDATYPAFHRLLERLNVPVRNSDMSFGFHCEKTGLQYCGDNFNTLFAQRKNFFKPSHWKMLSDVVKFGNIARSGLKQGNIDSDTVGEFLKKYQFSTSFIENYLLPMGAAIWSTPTREMMRFPAKTFLQFFDNHGLLSRKPPQWQTVVGGSHSYIKSFTKQFQGEIFLNHAVQHVLRNDNSVALELSNGESLPFDCVILASHADETFNLLKQPTRDEQRLLGVWKYVNNKAVLHTDPSVMPSNRRAWASWNYKRENVEDVSDALSMSYDMNRLQGLTTQQNYFVTLNSHKPIKKEAIIKKIQYMHPFYNFDSVQTQSELHKLNGINRTYFCGSYFGYGFHEDAVKSGVQVARHFGLDL